MTDCLFWFLFVCGFFCCYLAKILASPREQSVDTITLISGDRITETEFTRKKTKPFSKLRIPQTFRGRDGTDAEVAR